MCVWLECSLFAKVCSSVLKCGLWFVSIVREDVEIRRSEEMFSLRGNIGVSSKLNHGLYLQSYKVVWVEL